MRADDLDVARVVEVWGGPKLTDAPYGSGYVIAGNLVLTSDHTVAELDSTCQIRPLGEKDWTDGIVAWRGDGAALVRLTQAPRGISPVRFGRFGSGQQASCRAIGFPEAQARRRDGVDVRDTEEIVARTLPGSALKGGLLTLTIVESSPKAMGSLGSSPWQGISGSAVFSGPLLVGILKVAPAKFGTDRLQAVRVASILAEPEVLEIMATVAGASPVSEVVEDVPAIEQSLRAPYLPLPDRVGRGEGPPSLPLRPEYGVVRFRGREEELAWLQDWTQEPSSPVGVAVLFAGPGAGKTRLASEFAQRCSETGWTVGVLREGLDRPGLDALADISTPLLVVIDDAPSRILETAELLVVLDESGRETPTRLLLLARDDGDWRTDVLPTLLQGTGGPEVTLSSMRLRSLSSVEPRRSGRVDAFDEAVTKFTTLLRASGRPAGPRPDLSQGLFADILCVHLAALTSVVGDPAVLHGRIAADDLLHDLLVRESKYWERSGPPSGPARDDKAVRARVVALATLTTAQDENEAAMTLRAVPDLADASEHDLRAIARWLKTLYPASEAESVSGEDPVRRRPPEQWFRALMPDLVGEYLVASVLADTGELAARLLAVASLAQTEHALATLTRSAKFHAAPRDALQAAFDRGIDNIWEPALRVAQRTGDPIGQLLAFALERAPDADLATAIAAQIPTETVALSELAVTSTQQALERVSRDPSGPERDAARAPLAHNLAIRLSDIGRFEDALVAIDEATGIYRTLAEQRPDAYLPDLAMSLNNQAGRLSDLGRHEEALTTIDQATSIYRTLAEQRPDAYRPYLASALSNQSVALADVGRHEEALTAIDQAVRIGRALAEQRPDAYLPDLAMSLNNQAGWLGDLGRHEEALTTIAQAIDIYRTLAEQRPDAFLPDLAMSLNNQAVPFASLDRHEEALATVDAATAIYTTLAEQRPDAFLPHLAMSVSNRSIELADLGRHAEALAAVDQATGIYRTLAEQRPDAFVPRLVASLNNRSDWLSDIGRHSEAVTTTDEVVAIALPLLERWPFSFPEAGSGLRQRYLAVHMQNEIPLDPTTLARLDAVLPAADHSADTELPPA